MSKKKKNDETGGAGKFFAVQEHTKQWIFSILSFLLSIFFILAAFKKAGLMGEKVYTALTLLFGMGYFLFPLIGILLGITFLRNKKLLFVFTSFTGGVLFFFSGLGLIEMLRNEGGILGALVSRVLVNLFDFYATIIILVALSLVSLLLIFDTTPSLSGFLRLLSFLGIRRPPTDSENINQNKEITDRENPPPTLGLETAETTPLVKEDSGKPVVRGESDARESARGGFLGFGKNGRREALQESLFGGMETYTPPPFDLLGADKGKPGYGDIKANSNIIKRTLQNFGINVEMDEVSVGPSVTRYALKPAQGVKLARIVGLQNDLSLALAAHPLRIEAPIPGKSLVGIEIPNSSRTTVGLSSILDTEEFNGSKLPLLISVGRSITGKAYFGNLAKMPHLLIAGATGSGKSVAIHTIITSLLYRNAPAHLRFIMIDAKRVELTLWNAIPHLLTPVITEAKKAILALKWAAKEMERRYDILETESVRDIESYHENVVAPAYTKAREEKSKRGMRDESISPVPELPEQMPYIIIVLDELADIMSTYPRELEAAIIRLAQMSRAVGIHLILSTQRPSVNIITGLIKANIPSRVAFQVPSQTDSRTILDIGGAEKLLGAGDMLYLSGEMSKPVRLQGAFIGEGEIKKVSTFLSKEYGKPLSSLALSDSEENTQSIFDFEEEEENTGTGDELYEEARETVVKTGKASTTFLQRKLRIGYARAARLMDMLEEYGVVGPADGARPREVLGGDAEGYGERPKDGAEQK